MTVVRKVHRWVVGSVALMVGVKAGKLVPLLVDDWAETMAVGLAVLKDV